MMLIDTSAWIFALKKSFHSFVKERIEKIFMESDVAINGMIELELLGGVKTEKEYERLKSRLDALYYIETDRSLWDYASKLAIHLKRKGVHVPYADILIAASAMQEKAILVHTDAHFDAISKYSELKVESLLAHL